MLQPSRSLKKGSECFEGLMLRQAQQNRENPDDIKTPPVVLSTVEGLRRSFSAAC
jgi:hypothetical protein